MSDVYRFSTIRVMPENTDNVEDGKVVTVSGETHPISTETKLTELENITRSDIIETENTYSQPVFTEDTAETSTNESDSEKAIVSQPTKKNYTFSIIALIVISLIIYLIVKK